MDLSKEYQKSSKNTESIQFLFRISIHLNSAVGCYINFLETEQAIFLSVFGVDMDSKAIDTAQNIFNKTIVPVNINEIAEQSGVLNCISWDI